MGLFSDAQGFRPFFLGATLFGIFVMVLWFLSYHFQLPISGHLSFMIWHGHEMIFGFVAAVIAGFLLTAVKNWTGIPAVNDSQLIGLSLAWLLARLVIYWVWCPLWLVAGLDMAWLFGVIVMVARPILKVKQWKNLGVLFKTIFLGLSNLCFYLGLSGAIEDGARIGLYSGLYLSVALTIEIADRIIPGFTERGVDKTVSLRRWPMLNKVSLFLFTLFWLLEIWWPNSLLPGLLALPLGTIYLLRLIGWYTHGIWKKPLLWILHVGFFFIALGFLLKFLALVLPLSPFIALHALALGGVGLIVLGMVARVSWAHSGRNVHAPPPTVFWCFLLLAISTVARVLLPLVWPQIYCWWIGLAQVAWILAYLVLLTTYLPLWLSKKTTQAPCARTVSTKMEKV